MVKVFILVPCHKQISNITLLYQIKLFNNHFTAIFIAYEDVPKSWYRMLPSLSYLGTKREGKVSCQIIYKLLYF